MIIWANLNNHVLTEQITVKSKLQKVNSTAIIITVSNSRVNNSPNAEMTIPAVRNIAVSFMTLRL